MDANHSSSLLITFQSRTITVHEIKREDVRMVEKRKKHEGDREGKREVETGLLVKKKKKKEKEMEFRKA